MNTKKATATINGQKISQNSVMNSGLAPLAPSARGVGAEDHADVVDEVEGAVVVSDAVDPEPFPQPLELLAGVRQDAEDPGAAPGMSVRIPGAFAHNLEALEEDQGQLVDGIRRRLQAACMHIRTRRALKLVGQKGLVL